jgi:hypothetical protein
MVLLAVAVAIAVAALAAATLIFVAWAHVESGRRAVERAQLQSLAWSGVRGVMAELSSQRETLLLGGEPLLTPAWTLFEDGGVRGSVRLLPVSGVSVAMSEAGKLDLAHVTPTMLAKLPGLRAEGDVPGAAPAEANVDASRVPAGIDRSTPAPERAARLGARRGNERGDEASQGPVQDESEEAVPELVTRIIAARDAGLLVSGEGLGDVEGLTRDLLEGQEATRGTGMGGLRSIELGRTGLLDLLGVFASEPETSIGVTGGATDAASRGLARVSVEGGWDEAVAADVRTRASDAAFAAIERILSAKARPANEPELVARLFKDNLEPAAIGEVLDLLTFGDDEYRLGRVNINHATGEVIAAIPGFDEATAERVVQERLRLDSDTLRRVTWPLERGIIEPDAFVLASRWITTRSMVWRVRVEATLIAMSRAASEGEPRGAARDGTSLRDQDDVAQTDIEEGVPRVVYEAVIDASGPLVRVAYLRDITLGGVARAVEERVASAGFGARSVSPDSPEVEKSVVPPEVAPAPLSRAERMRAERGEDDATNPNQDDITVADEVDATDTPEGTPGAGRQPLVRKDRRVGRWTRGGGGS